MERKIERKMGQDGVQGMTSKSLRPTTQLFLLTLAITIAVWVLRGLGILTFLPGGLIWLLILLSIGTGVVNGLMGTRR